MKIMEIALKRIDVPGLLIDTLDQVLEPALQKLVDSTATPFDNAAKMALYGPLRKALVELSQEKWAELAVRLVGPADPPSA